MIYLHQIDPIILSLGPLKLHWYGLMYLLAFVTAWWLGRMRASQGRLPGVDANAFSDLMFYGMLGVMAAAWWWSRKHRLHFFDTMDFVAPVVAPGLGFGRIGNFIGAELWGKQTHGDWGVIFPTDPALRGLDAAQLQAQYAAGALDPFARHPSQLYQALLEGLVMFVVLWTVSRKPRARYTISGLFALMYGVFRFVVEFVRVPDADIGYLAFGWLTMGQVLSLPLVALGLFLLALSRRAPTLQPVLPAPGAGKDFA